MRAMWLVLISALVWVGATGCDSGGCKKATEVCDNLDNDCDGVIDNGLQRICQTACGTGVEYCQAGEWRDCDARAPQAETCNGLDDDCDGMFDEQEGAGGLPLEQACNTACGAGTEYCFMGSWQDCTAAEPVAEICDGEDNDCDGATDEDLDTDADQDGHYTTDSCATPNDDCNDADNTVHGGHAEDCDAKDNNCNLQIDEGCDCTPGNSQDCGSTVGECVQGTQECQAGGAWGPCVDGDGNEVILPGSQAELCDDKDNDCDGSTDEGNPEGGGVCGTNEGVCQEGTWVCTEAGVLECQGGVEPTDEICNVTGGSQDDDCDGLTDEGLPGDDGENDSCNNDYPVTVDSNTSPVLVTRSLYKWQNDAFVADEDWMCAAVKEPSSFCLPGDPQCMYLTVQLDLPAQADHTQWQVCLYGHGSNNCSQDCGNLGDPICTDAALDWQNGHYLMTVAWSGDCLFTDDNNVSVVVKSADGALVAECSPYDLTLTMAKTNEACQ